MNTFKEFGLIPQILRAIEKIGFIEPTPIQEKTIPILLDSSRDLIAQAQTGTGKTAAFGLPLLQLTNRKSLDVQTLILCPTRELCIQLAKDMESYSRYIDNLHILAVYGGANIVTQINSLKRGHQIVVGTPGRTLDLIRRKNLKPVNIRWLILDEADKMLEMGFQEELDMILAETPDEKQTLLFSATIPNGIEEIAAKYISSPIRISVSDTSTGADNIEHEYYKVQARDRYETLKRISDVNPNIYGLVFCRTRRDVKEIADKLIHDGYNADALHGDLSQGQRDFVMKRFRTKKLQILVATDVAARGLDIDNLSHVINYNLPEDLENYVHRSGRTGRAGKSGISVAIIHSREINKIRNIEKILGKKFTQKQVPNAKEICEKQLFNLIGKIEKVEVDHQHIDQFMPVIYEKLSWLDREELIKHFVSFEFNRFFSYYKNARDLNIEKQPKKSRVKGCEEGFSRFFLNIGSKKNLNPSRLIGLINEKTRIRNINIGKIEIQQNFTFFEAESRFEAEILKAFQKAVFSGEPIKVELSKARPQKSYPEKKYDQRTNRMKKQNRKKRYTRR